MKRGTIDHPKMDELCAELDIPRYAAVGILNTLWDWAARYVPQGDIGKYSDRVIAKKIEWESDPATLIAALVKSKWIDASEEHRLVIHDWPEHCEDFTHTQLARQGLLFADGSMPKLTKLSEKERLAAQARYEELSCAERRTPAQNGAQSALTIPCLAIPEPEPSQGEGARGAPDPAIPPILEPAQYAVEIIKRCKLVSTAQLLFAIAESVRLLGDVENVALNESANRLVARVKAAQKAGETVSRFWFEDGKWKAAASRDGPRLFQPGYDPSANAEAFDIGEWRARYDRGEPVYSHLRTLFEKQDQRTKAGVTH